MKKISAAMMKIAVVVVAVFSLIIAANAGYVSSQAHTITTTSIQNASTDFYANITVQLYEGTGCDCYPIRDEPINATGRDTDHFTSGVTDDRGQCILQLEFDKTYRISIQDANHESVMMDFVVIDNQAFTFHMKIIQGGTDYHGSFLQMLLHKFFLAKK
jgi:hypothetical protein